MNKFRGLLIILFVVCFLGLAFVCFAPSHKDVVGPSLNQFKCHGASVLPYTYWPSNSKEKYFLISEEGYGADRHTWDDWGGGKDPEDKHSLETASREFTEESMGLLEKFSTTSYIEDPKHSKEIVVNKAKKMVTCITYIPYEQLDNLARSFYQRRSTLFKQYLKEKNQHNPTKMKQLQKKMEKKTVGWISSKELQKVVKTAPRNANGKLITPIFAKVLVIDKRGKKQNKVVSLRPVFVSKLQPFFQELSYTTNEYEENIRYY